MTTAVEVLSAWDKTLETQVFDHLRKYLSDDFQFENSQGEINDLEHTKTWCTAGALRIDNFKTIRENESYIVATHDVLESDRPPSNVLVYAEQSGGKFTYWRIQRAFAV